MVTTATPNDGKSTFAHPGNIAVFGAIGTIIGYFGIEIGSDSLFERLLWPTRFYNTLNPISLLQTTLLTPMGGPILRPAIRVLDEFKANRLFNGQLQGDPLGTAFYSNSRQRYKLHTAEGSRQTQKEDTHEFRNCLWIRVLRLTRAIDDSKPGQDPEAGDHTKSVSARRSVYLLDLTPTENNTKTATAAKAVLKVSGDVGALRPRNFIGVFCSELVAICTGICVAIIFKSFYTILFFLPFLLKFIALIFSVRRQPLAWPKPPTTKEAQKMQFKDDIAMLEFDRERDRDDFILIKGSKQLLHQFSHHYGHPLRKSKDVFISDRTNEVISMALVFAFAMVFPVSLLASIWANPNIQWTWLGYEAYATVSMYGFRFKGGELVGSTEMMLAKELAKKKKVALVDDDGKGVVASLETWTENSVREGMDKVKGLLQEWE
ncbi:hypothetical protein P7C71_g5566, partial [Lecanoromycetidae sp. Uapishka_2]